MGVVGDPGGGDRRVVGAAVEEDLLELVAADVAEYAAVLASVEEPVRPAGRVTRPMAPSWMSWPA